MKNFGVLIIIIFPLVGCLEKTETIDDAYVKEMETWKERRLEAVTGPDGWATLIGLHWFSEGETTMGSDSSGTIILPSEVPAYLGSFFVQGEQVIFSASDDSRITVGDSTISSVNINTENNPIFKWETFSWYVIKRSGRLGLRIRDTMSPEILNFKGLNYFPLNPEWIIKASFELHEPPKTKIIQTVLDMTIEYPNPATLFFEYGGEQHSLEALDEGGDEYFLIFSDETSAVETYGAGRYMYISKTPVDGFLTLDFNKCYNPPCAFTPFATCPIPPPENQLKLSIKAGEKDYH